ncbi:alpha/beta hydrolase [Paracraurococcus lichenis]|uniref:Alpha/beta hydrolase-fold protein n=1 Tax=Paracraurococcus lichenis TaxID=3064888 RepID=A0ABT9E9E0_9PROT|nr:alpha/beta hydrolase-fold protein [Paracraurococcus sp. LOR1-02]MDO9712685.1 alpha/beta hydrolase-fold protein [Paracraurococcus sp. LOR1-02]
MNRTHAVLAVSLLSTALAASATAQGTAPVANATVPPGANTSDPSAPFYIDLTGLDLQTMPPTRDPTNSNYPPATELPDGAVPPRRGSGNFIIGPTHTAAPETAERPDRPKGQVHSFTLTSADSVIYKPGRVREESSLNATVYTAPTAPGDPSNLIITSSHAGSWTRTVTVYVPPGYSPGTEAPLLVAGDGDLPLPTAGQQLFTVLDNLIAEHRIPPVVAVTIGSGGQDAQGSERGREYDEVSGTYADWVESEVLPAVEQKVGIRLTRDPNARATMGISSSGAAAFTMAWFRPDLYRRVLAYSPTFVNQQWPHDPALPGGAWEYHSPWAGPARPNLVASGFTPPALTDASTGSPLVPNSPRKPIRFWFEVGDHDLFYPAVPLADGMHDWVLANENMARALAAKRYQYQFVFARNASHVDGPTTLQTLPTALEWVWAGYPQPVK